MEFWYKQSQKGIYASSLIIYFKQFCIHIWPIHFKNPSELGVLGAKEATTALTDC